MLRAEWPGMKPFWPFSQYAMSAPYPLYATGLCFLAVLLFYLACDVGGLRFPHLTVLGFNPLVVYILQALLVLAAGMTVPKDAPPTIAFLTFVAVYLTCFGVAWRLYRAGKTVKI